MLLISDLMIQSGNCMKDWNVCQSPRTTARSILGRISPAVVWDRYDRSEVRNAQPVAVFDRYTPEEVGIGVSI